MIDSFLQKLYTLGESKVFRISFQPRLKRSMQNNGIPPLVQPYKPNKLHIFPALGTAKSSISDARMIIPVTAW